MKRLIELTPGEIRAAALSIVTEHGHIESSRIADLVVRNLTGSYLSDPFVLGLRPGQHREIRNAQVRFSARVRAQLDQLAVRDLIVKIGAHQTLPNGYRAGGIAHYFNPAAFDAAVQKHSDDLKAHIAQQERWQKIRVRLLDGAGVNLSSQRKLSAEHWEQLLDRAGW